LLSGRGFCVFVNLGRLRCLHAGGDGSGKVEMNGGADPFGTFDAGKTA
jgi:hypothetical protein